MTEDKRQSRGNMIMAIVFGTILAIGLIINFIF